MIYICGLREYDGKHTRDKQFHRLSLLRKKIAVIVIPSFCSFILVSFLLLNDHNHDFQKRLTLCYFSITTDQVVLIYVSEEHFSCVRTNFISCQKFIQTPLKFQIYF